MILIEYPKDVRGIKATDCELFIYEENKLITTEDFESYKLIEDTSSDNYYFIESNMVGKYEKVLTPLFISRMEMPLKGDVILRNELDGNYSLDICKKNLSNKDVYHESTRIVFKVVCSLDNMSSEHLDKIKSKEWSKEDKFHLECENRIYNKHNNKEVDYMFYESKNIIFKTKEPSNIFKV